MKFGFGGFLLTFALAMGVAAEKTAVAAEPSPAQQAQREKMKSCNAKASEQGLKKDERKAFMKECLSKDKKVAAEPSPAQQAQREKMKSCNAQAGEQGLKGDKRKVFISACLER